MQESTGSKYSVYGKCSDGISAAALPHLPISGARTSAKDKMMDNV